MTSLTDDFNRADGPLGANWQTWANPALGATPTIFSNAFNGRFAGAKYIAGATWANNFLVRATVKYGASAVISPWVGVVNAADQGYFIEASGPTTPGTDVYVGIDFMPTDGNYDLLGAYVQGTPIVPGGEFALEMKPGGVMNGLYRATPGSGAWTTVLTRTDSRYVGPWRAIVACNDITSGTTQVDAFAIEDVVVAVTAPGPSLGGTSAPAPGKRPPAQFWPETKPPATRRVRINKGLGGI